MRRLILPRRKLLLGAAAALITSPAIIRGAMAQVPMTGAGKGTPGGSASFSFIAGTSASDPGTTVTTSSIDTTGAGLLIINCSYYSGREPTTISDSKSNTWNSLTPSNSGGAVCCNTYWCKPTTVGSGHTATVSNALAMFASMTFSAYAGGAASPFDQQAQNNGYGGTVTGPSVTPTVNNELVIAIVGNEGIGVSVSSIDDGFTIIGTPTAHGSVFGNAAAYKIQTSAGAEAPEWTFSGGSVASWAAASSTYKVS